MEADKATRAAARADALAAKADRKHAAADATDADQRADQRTLDGHSRVVADLGERGKIVDASPAATGEYRDRVIDRMAERADQIAYWKQVREQQIANGQATNYGPDTINKGDAVKTWHGWSRVIRVNKKTVSVDVSRYYQAPTRIITDTTPYHEIRDHKPATEARDLDATG